MLTINDLLIARDLTAVSDRAFRQAIDLAARSGATLHVLFAEVLHAVPDREEDRPTPAEDFDQMREDLKRRGTTPADALDDVTVEEVVRRDVAPAPAILNYASDADIDMIVLGTQGRRGMSRILLGSVAEEVVRRAQCPVLTVRGEEEGSDQHSGSPQRILVPVDFSDHSREALRYAHEWSKLYEGAAIDVLHVVEENLHPAFYVGGVRSVYDVEPNLDQKALEKLEAFVEETVGPSVEADSHVVSGTAASAIPTFVEEHAVDLVAMSTHGRTGMDRFLLGSVAEKVVRHVRCPVLTVKAFGKSLVSSDVGGQNA